MGLITQPVTYADGNTLTGAQLTSSFNTIYNEFNGNIDNDNIDASAAIAYSKLNLSNSIVNADIDDAAAIAQSKLAGTFPASGLIVGTTDEQTLSGKTLTKPTINGSTQAYTTDNSGAFDLAASNIHVRTLDGTNGALSLSNAATGQVFVVRLVQDGTGSRTVTWWSTIKWANGTAPTLSTTAARVDVFAFICTGTDTYDGFVVGQNLS